MKITENFEKSKTKNAKNRTKRILTRKVFSKALTYRRKYGLICNAVLTRKFCFTKPWGRFCGNQYRRQAEKPPPEKQSDAEGAGGSMRAFQGIHFPAGEQPDVAVSFYA